MGKNMHALLSAMLLVVLTACAKKSEEPAEAPARYETAADASMATAGAAPQASVMGEVAEAGVIGADNAVSPEQLTSSAATYVDQQRRFIRTANADFRVKDVYQSAIAIENVVAGLGGFVVSNQIRSNVERLNRYPMGASKLIELTEYTVRGNLIVRVPSEKTQEFLRAIVSQIDFLDQRNFSAQDVQFELLRKQLEFARNQEAQRQLGELNDSPGKISDKAAVISGQSNAKANRDEAAVAQREVADKVAFSTITLSLYQSPKVNKTEVDDVGAIAKAIRPSFFKRLLGAMSEGWYALLDIVIWIVMLWPLWLVTAAFAFGFKRFRERRRSPAP